MEKEKELNSFNHSINVVERKNILITGVKKVDSFDNEEFLVETDTKEKAYMCAYQYFQEPKFLGEVSYFEAEMMGIDTYWLLKRI